MGAQQYNVSDELRGKGVGFKRLARITGYMSTSTECWGNAKQAEEKARVKHSVA